MCDSGALPKSSVFHVERDAGGTFLVEEAEIQGKAERLAESSFRAGGEMINANLTMEDR